MDATITDAGAGGIAGAVAGARVGAKAAEEPGAGAVMDADMRTEETGAGTVEAETTGADVDAKGLMGTLLQ